MEWAVGQRIPKAYQQSNVAVSLLPADAPGASETCTRLEREAGYEHVELLGSASSNTDAFRILRQAGLVLAQVDTDDPVSGQLHTIAHAKCIPTIRIRRSAADLPWLLRGHPGGYEKDIISWTDPIELAAQIESRARRCSGLARRLRMRGPENTSSPDTMFLSATPCQLAIASWVEDIHRSLRQNGVQSFEYHASNEAGDN